MGLIQTLYDKSPISIQNILISLSGYHRNRSRYGKTYYDHLKFLEEFDKWTLDEKLEYQHKELISFVDYTQNNSKYYKELYNNFEISCIQSINDIKKLPIVDKEMLRENIDDVVTVNNTKMIEGHTGGTTGKSLVVQMTYEDMMKRMAMLDHFKSRIGFKHLEMRRATFNGKHIVPPRQKKDVYWRYNLACKQMIYSSFHLTEQNMKFYVDSLNRFKPQAIDGFFMSICDIASYIERHKLKLEFVPIAIFPTSETLTKSGRELLERVFNCKVYDQYASSEGAPFITECKHQVLHIELSTGVFEHMEENNDEILVTSFTTHGTPLIRYRIGDSIKLDKITKLCECGIESQIVKEIKGRKLDFLYTTDGAKVNSGNISNLFKNVPNAIIRAQAIQDQIDEIKILLEIDKTLYKPEYDELIRKEFAYKFGENTRIIIKHIDEIPREKSGKFRFVINNISK